MLLDIQEIAKMFKVHVRTIRRWIDTKDMPTIKIAGTLRFDPEDVLRWAKELKDDDATV